MDARGECFCLCFTSRTMMSVAYQFNVRKAESSTTVSREGIRSGIIAVVTRLICFYLLIRLSINIPRRINSSMKGKHHVFRPTTSFSQTKRRQPHDALSLYPWHVFGRNTFLRLTSIILTIMTHTQV